jgi:hypothetical protein
LESCRTEVKRRTEEIVKAAHNGDPEQFKGAVTNFFGFFGVEPAEDPIDIRENDKRLRKAMEHFLNGQHCDIEFRGKKGVDGITPYGNIYLKPLRIPGVRDVWSVCPGACSLPRESRSTDAYVPVRDIYIYLEKFLGIDTDTTTKSQYYDAGISPSQRSEKAIHCFAVGGHVIQLPAKDWSHNLVDKLVHNF